MDDGFADYRKFCANRMRRLERYKKAKSFCNVENENSGCFKQSASITATSSYTDDDEQPIQQELRILSNNNISSETEPNSYRYYSDPIQSSSTTLRKDQQDQADYDPLECRNERSGKEKFDILKEKMVRLIFQLELILKNFLLDSKF